MALSVDTTPAKHVTVLRNGDNKYQGRKFIISRRRYRTFDSLLSDITHQISAPFGAVRRLYTPKGSRQIQGIDDLEGGATYIAGGTERFKKIEYSPVQHFGRHGGFNSNIKPGFLADEPPPLVLPKKNRKYAQRSAQFHKVRQPVQFTVFRNGLPSDKGARFLLKSREMKTFETVLSIISFKIRLVEGAVRKLYTVDGALLVGPDEITDGGQYVACGHRRFLPGLYGEANTLPKLHKLPAIKRNRYVSQQSPRTQSNPLPAIQKKGTEASQKTARSDKDSPAPIAEEKGNAEDVIVIVSRGSQVDVLEDSPAIEPDNAVFGIENVGSVPTPPPLSGDNDYDNDGNYPETEQESVFEADSRQQNAVQSPLGVLNPGNQTNEGIYNEVNGKVEDDITMNGNGAYDIDDNGTGEYDIDDNDTGEYEFDDNGTGEYDIDDNDRHEDEPVHGTPNGVSQIDNDRNISPAGVLDFENEQESRKNITPTRSKNGVDHAQLDNGEVSGLADQENEIIEGSLDNFTVGEPLENGIPNGASVTVGGDDTTDNANLEPALPEDVTVERERSTKGVVGRRSVAEEIIGDKNVTDNGVAVKEEDQRDGRESTIPDMTTEEGDPVEDSISGTEISTVPNKSKLPATKTANQAISSEEIQEVTSVTSKVSKPTITTASSKPNIKTVNGKPNISTSPSKAGSKKKPSKEGGLENGPSSQLVTEDGLFNATGATANNNQDGKFLMDNQENHGQSSTADEVVEDNDLVEDKPVDLQHAEEVEED